MSEMKKLIKLFEGDAPPQHVDPNQLVVFIPMVDDAEGFLSLCQEAWEEVPTDVIAFDSPNGLIVPRVAEKRWRGYISKYGRKPRRGQ